MAFGRAKPFNYITCQLTKASSAKYQLDKNRLICIKFKCMKEYINKFSKCYAWIPRLCCH